VGFAVDEVMFFMIIFAIAMGFALVGWHLLALTYIMRRFCDKVPLRLRPLDPDGAAGLRPLARLAFALDLIPLIGMVAILYNTYVAGILLQDQLVFIGAIIILMIIVFFFPLAKAHGSMSETKRKILNDLSMKHNEAFEELMLEMRLPGHKITESNLLVIDKTDQLYSRAIKMPVWPFDVTLLAKLATTIIVPIALMFGQRFI
jgi:hypothetical protein